MATTSPWVALLACLSACGPSADKVPANDNATPAAAQPAGGVAPVAPPVTVVDYYNRMVEIDAANHLYQFPYRISKTPLGWRCFDADSELDRSYPCVVDVPNGFLSIEDEGTGSGMSITQIALFKKANGQIIMALNTQRREPVTFMTFTGTLPTFYAYRDGAFTTITKEVMPDTVTGDAFAAAPGTADSVFMFYDLPRHGTDITASVDLGFADYCKKPESERGAMNPDLLESVNRRCKIYNGLVRKSVALHFDKRTGRFELPK